MWMQTRASVLVDVLARGGRGTDAGVRDAGRPVIQNFTNMQTIWGTASTHRSSLIAIYRRTPCSFPVPVHSLAASAERA